MSSLTASGRAAVVLGLLFASGLCWACSRDEAGQRAPSAASEPIPAPAARQYGERPLLDGPAQAKHETEDVCALLTTDEVTTELKKSVSAKMLPRAGEYGAPTCGWFSAADAPGTPKLRVALFRGNERGRQAFTKKLEDVCRANRVKVDNLGDEAALCGELWVRKGSNFFYVSSRAGDADVPWPAAVERLARLVLTRLP